MSSTIRVTTQPKRFLVLGALLAALASGVPSGAEAARKDPFQPDIPTELVAELNRARTERFNAKRVSADQPLSANKLLEQAKARLEKILEQTPDYFLAWYNLGLTEFSLGNADRSKESLERAIAIREENDLKDFTVYNTLGWIHFTAGDYDSAERNFLKALQGEAHNDENSNRRLYNNLGILYQYKNDLPSAEKYLEVAATRYKSTSAAERLLAVRALRAEQARVETPPQAP